MKLTHSFLNTFQEYLDLDAVLMSPLEPQTPTSSEPNSTPRNSLGTDHYTDNDDRDTDNVFVDNPSDVWESRQNTLTALRRDSESMDTRKMNSVEQLDKKFAVQERAGDADEDKKQTSFVASRLPIQSDV